MSFTKSTLLAFLYAAIFVVMPVSASAEEAAPAPNGSLVMFLTQTDPMVAGHGLHIANHMLEEERNVTLVLIGAAGQIAVKAAVTNSSSLADGSLQEALAAFIAKGGTAAITPPTVAGLGVDYEDLIDGVGPPADHRALHDHMFAPRTKLMVF